MIKKIFFNVELNTTAEYTEVWKYEVVKVKDVPDLLVRNHYWQDAQGELWLDFEDPNENFRGIFNAYRKRKGFMQPWEVKKLRANLGLSLRDFAERLGISYAKVSQIENNKRIQTLAQEVAFRKAQQDYQRQGYLTSYAVAPSSGETLTRVLGKVKYQDTVITTYQTPNEAGTNRFKYVGGVA
ncbi:helix-turn-helix domain-containing protein [Lactiplantibacillus garii]|uniref:Helix-turn-helix domain-containing protein n=1 Tax=Lactiplantibacillus garii TaxID=2306423 RepID=A0A3R8J6J1_9LACO|nr:helix-turn-helix domain-containing protein [Lactiplantibacillus garii]RRK09758.1 helix-turn-helix domain-containing protein [Lactiplantibacillus garii]